MPARLEIISNQPSSFKSSCAIARGKIHADVVLEQQQLKVILDSSFVFISPLLWWPLITDHKSL